MDGEGAEAKEAPSVLPIDRRTIHQICSGQVVLNLATAMKELLENSLDAGATSVDIRLKENGAELVEVSDDGHGVEPHNFEALTLKHHTSKLRDFSDLTAVETFGFRGEALSSLCALSNLAITTRHKSQMAGTKLEYDHNGKIVSKTPCAREQGTTVNLTNLFSTLPVRHKEFLRNIKKEFAKLVHVLNGYCLISSGVRIMCTNLVGKGKKMTLVSTTGSEQRRDNITCVFGAKQVQSLMPFKQIKPSEEECIEYNIKDSQSIMYQVTGFISKADHGLGRSTADRQFLYINKRPCDLIKVSRAVNEVYHMFNRHQYPFIMLDISLQRDAVDVNVTPDKRQVFMQEEKLLLAIIKSSLKNMFDTGTSTYQVNQKPLNQLNLSVIRNHEQSTKNDEKCKQTHPESSIAGNLSVTCFPSLKSFKRPYSLIASESDLTREPKQAKLTNLQTLETTVSISEESNELEQSLDNTSSACDACENNSDLFIICKDGLKSDSNAAVILEDELHIAEKRKRKPENFDVEECETKTCEVNNASTNVIDLSLRKSPPGIKQEVEIFEPNIIDNSESLDKTPTPLKLNSQCKRQDLKEIVKGRKTLCIDFNIARFKKPVDVKKNEQKLETTARLFREKISPENNTAAEEELTKNITKESFAKMEILGQFNLGFILTKLGDDLFIVDQHASDEKYNFEYQQKHTSLNTQRLIIPKKLELTAANECVLMENIDIFRKNGFEFEIDDEAEATKKTKLISVPVSKNWTFGVEDVEELIFMLSDSPGVMCRPTRVRKMFASRACRMSIMVGTALSREQMKMIINHMGDMDHPWNCPHGRPTMRHVINLNMIPML